MLLADTSVWIDFFKGAQGDKVDLLQDRIRQGSVIIGDLILAEILQGIDGDREFNRIRRLLAHCDQLQICNETIAIEAARNFRHLRALGITVRKTIDTLIATRCICDGIPLLFSDRDFEPFVEHLGLQSAITANTR